MPGDTFQLKSVAIKCFQGCWDPRKEKNEMVSIIQKSPII